MAKNNSKNKIMADKGNGYPEYDPFLLYGILICSVLISGMGIYLIISNRIANGIIYGGRYGVSVQKTSISGISTLIIGVLVSVFPIYQLIKINKRKKAK